MEWPDRGARSSSPHPGIPAIQFRGTVAEFGKQDPHAPQTRQYVKDQILKVGWREIQNPKESESLCQRSCKCTDLSMVRVLGGGAASCIVVVRVFDNL